MRNMLIIGGASKSGTTALYYYLRQHPEICLSEKKELHYFSRPFLEKYSKGPGDLFVLTEVLKSIGAYQHSFSHCNSSTVTVDISPSYLFHYRCADEINTLMKKAKVIFILRNPVDKIYSQYLHLVGEGRETLSFEDALDAEPKRQSEGYSDMWLYRKSGKYAEAIKYFQKTLGHENVIVFYYDEFLSEPSIILKKICEFSKIDKKFNFKPIINANRSGSPKSILAAKLLAPNILTYLLRRIIPQSLGRIVRKTLKDLNTGQKQQMTEATQQKLLAEYINDIHKLESLIGRKSGWIK